MSVITFEAAVKLNLTRPAECQDKFGVWSFPSPAAIDDYEYEYEYECDCFYSLTHLFYSVDMDGYSSNVMIINSQQQLTSEGYIVSIHHGVCVMHNTRCLPTHKKQGHQSLPRYDLKAQKEVIINPFQCRACQSTRQT